ncbi:ADP-ribosylation factor-like protein [Candidatus Albibeggiatoa sp. nov. BB20]|uniref:ADP-ribosylation factor-like protein n=1 Tax=Candidatus Albibeggiatoa sp. nov. BB20 TaxID=3162723 RepID=UPI0033655E4D
MVKQGIKAIQHYCKSLEQEQKPLNEIKILLVGDGGAGKTSLLKQLNNQEFNAQESKTHGINIQSLTLQTQNTQQEPIEVTGHLLNTGSNISKALAMTPPYL